MITKKEKRLLDKFNLDTQRIIMKMQMEANFALERFVLEEFGIKMNIESHVLESKKNDNT
jgi:hypothetical protein